MTRSAVTVALPLPPTANMAYKHIWRKDGSQSKAYSDTYYNWREYALYCCRDLRLPERTPLTVAIRIRLAPNAMHRSDVDGYIKPLLDAVVGSHRDQWVMDLDCSKRPADVGDEGVEVNVTWEGKG